MLMAQNKNGYIPAGIQRSMDQHMKNMPANLQKYQSGNTYIPAHAAKQMETYMNKSMPAHMKEYITPYMHQKTTAGLNSLDPVRSQPMQPRAPAPDLMRRDHSAFGEQFSVDTGPNNRSLSSTSLSFSPQYTRNNAATPAPPAPPPAPLPTGNGNNYDFIMNSPQPKRSFGSMKQRIIMVVVGGLVLLTIAIAAFALLSGSGGSNIEKLTDLAQQQTEIARIADIGTQKSTSAATKNLAFTTKLSLLSSKQQTVSFLAKKGTTLKDKQLTLKKNSATDQRLNDAASNNTFDATFTKLLTDELTSYRTALLAQFKNTTNSVERQLLQDGFNGASILLNSAKDS